MNTSFKKINISLKVEVFYYGNSTSQLPKEIILWFGFWTWNLQVLN